MRRKLFTIGNLLAIQIIVPVLLLLIFIVFYLQKPSQNTSYQSDIASLVNLTQNINSYATKLKNNSKPKYQQNLAQAQNALNMLQNTLETDQDFLKIYPLLEEISFNINSINNLLDPTNFNTTADTLEQKSQELLQAIAKLNISNQNNTLFFVSITILLLLISLAILVFFIINKSKNKTENIIRNYKTLNTELSTKTCEYETIIKALENKAVSLDNINQQYLSKQNTLSTATDKIAESLSQIANASHEISKNSANTKNEALNSITYVDNTKQTVNLTTHAIRELLQQIETSETVIKAVKANSSDITGALDVINNISEQTNLLALNAAIEAARAGEAGRGFAVVADEVRSLATKSRDSSDEIRNIIDSLHTNTKRSVEAMLQCKTLSQNCNEQAHNSKSTLQDITTAIEAIQFLIDNINSQNNQQLDFTNLANENLVALKTIFSKKGY